MNQKVAIIGGGASGIFCAIHLANNPNLEIHVFEKTDELLKKVKISGGGRCNVTHDYTSPSKFIKSYPRGSQMHKKNFEIFSPQDMYQWLINRGVQLKTEQDGRVFPLSDDSNTIVNCFLEQINKPNITVHFKSNFEEIDLKSLQTSLVINKTKWTFDKIVIATGGASNNSYLNIFKHQNIEIVETVPSLFTFKTENHDITELMGVSVPNAQIKILGTKLQEQGPLLITHWGFSGPAILKLSAWGAFHLAAKQYNFDISINWDATLNEEQVKTQLNQLRELHPKALIVNKKPESIPNRLWLFLLSQLEILHDKKWGDINKKEFNRILNSLVNSEFKIKGKTTFKEEFVTAGGISLQDINTQTMQSRKHPQLYFIGEILDVDGITGGFNFQNAWTTAKIASNHILSLIH